MKKLIFILFVLICLVFALTLNAQNTFYLNNISETELSVYPDAKYSTLNTVEDYLHSIEIKYGIQEVNFFLTAIENNLFDEYIQKLKLKGFIKEVNDISYMKTIFENSKLCFVSNSKIYVLTYEPVNINLKNSKYGDAESFIIKEKNLYLYRRDENGWVKASNLIRKDYNYDGISQEFDPHTALFAINNGKFCLDNLYYSSVNKNLNNSIVITINTIRFQNKKYINFNTLLILVPNNDETYNISYFEPLNIIGKILKNVNIDTYSWKTKSWNKKIGNITLPVLFSKYLTELNETSNGFNIKYNDGNKDSIIDAGTIYFKYNDKNVIYDSINSTIKLNKIK